MRWRLVYARQAHRDAKKLSASGLKPKAEKLLLLLSENPYRSPPPHEKLVGDLAGAYSRKINIHHRLVYQVLDEEPGVRAGKGISAGRWYFRSVWRAPRRACARAGLWR